MPRTHARRRHSIPAPPSSLRAARTWRMRTECETAPRRHFEAGLPIKGGWRKKPSPAPRCQRKGGPPNTLRGPPRGVPKTLRGPQRGLPSTLRRPPNILGSSKGAPSNPEEPPNILGSSKGASPNPEEPPNILGSSKGAPPNPEEPPNILGSSKGGPQHPEGPSEGPPNVLEALKGAPQDPEGLSLIPEEPPNILGSSKGGPQVHEGPLNILGSSKGGPQVHEGPPNTLGSSKGGPQDTQGPSKGAPLNPEGLPNILGCSKGSPQDLEKPSKGAPLNPEGLPNILGCSKGGPQDLEKPSKGAPLNPEGPPNILGSSKGGPQDPEKPSKGASLRVEEPPDILGALKEVPQDPKGPPNILRSSKGAPQDLEGPSNVLSSSKGSPQYPEGPSKGAPLKPEGLGTLKGAPQDPEGPPKISGCPPFPELGSLRAALEAALRREPGEPTPSELRPLLGVPLPPQAKCRHLDGAQLLRDNLSLDSGGAVRGLGGLRTALSILEKYGRNLLQPRPPRHWRGVRFGNPVFRSTVGAIQGGRRVLGLLGYTEQTGEGLSFPPDVEAPHGPRVASVTADVLLLRAEIDLLLANQHPNPHFFTDLLEQRAEVRHWGELGGTGRDWEGGSVCPWGGYWFILPLGADAGLAGSAPQRPPSPTRGDPSSLPSKWPFGTCQQPPGSMGQPPGAMGQPPGAMGQPPSSSGWACASCTFLNPGPSVLCGVCERPRLARRPPPAPQGWSCPHCTFWNEGPGPVCAICHRPQDEAPPSPTAGPTAGPTPCPTAGPERHTESDAERRRQQRLREDGSRLVAIVRAAEAQAVPAEAVWVAVGQSEAPPWVAVGQARAALGPALAALLEQTGPNWEELGPLSLREGRQGLDPRPRQPPQGLTGSTGSQEEAGAGAVGAGAVGAGGGAGAVPERGRRVGRSADLQRRPCGPCRDSCGATSPPSTSTAPTHRVLLALCRRALAALGAPQLGSCGAADGRWGASWARPRHGAELRDLLDAVSACTDPAALAALVRRLRERRARARMLGLLWCECALCPEVLPGALHGGGARAPRALPLVTRVRPPRPQRPPPALRLPRRPRRAAPAAPGSDTYQLFTQKVTELELLQDPQFLWCPQCSFGFIFEGERGPAHSDPQCHRRCCPRCRQPCVGRWGRYGVTMGLLGPRARVATRGSEFQGVAQRPRPPVRAVGLAAFLQEQRLTCPRCGLPLALARGGCLHCLCPHCQHHFCSACAGPFYPKDCCPDDRCPLRGSLHGHHPRRCLFYLRDWDPARLQRLLADANVPFETEPPPVSRPHPGGRCSPPPPKPPFLPPPAAPPKCGAAVGQRWALSAGGCGLVEQKEAPEGLRDEPCGRPTEEGHGGLCRRHYTEYLVGLVGAHALDPRELYDCGRAGGGRRAPRAGGAPPNSLA
ncbi:LOW QUALITY PROTEIN: E3 ubiquitin-protein ligase RNF31-like, partial [Cuculus canorus]|uniref:LOW QUALITY PROTEIN: E3 ubiquitin-protein ligase RNF31-like n=1 Tax=Cuculus canorus TaxID=55661 RepID=UPI0023AAC1C5